MESIKLPPLSQALSQIPRGPIKIQGETYIPVEAQTYEPVEIQTQVPVETVENETKNVVSTPATTTQKLVPMRLSSMVPEETEILVPVKVRKMVKKTNDVLVPVVEKTQKFMQLPGNTQIEELPNPSYQSKTAPIIQNTTFTPTLPKPTINQFTSPIDIQTAPIAPVTTTMTTTTTQIQNPAVSSYQIASNPAPISGIQNFRTEVPPLSDEEIDQILNQANLQSPPTSVQTEIQNYDIPSYQTEVFPQMDLVSAPQTTQITSVPQTQYETISTPVQYDVQNYQVESNPVTTITQEATQPISIPTPMPSPLPGPVKTTITTTTMSNPMPLPVPTTITTSVPTPIPAPVPTTITRTSVPTTITRKTITTTSVPTPIPAPVPTTITTTSIPTPIPSPAPTTLTT